MLAQLRNLVKEIRVFGESKILFKRGIAGSSLARSCYPSTGCLFNEGNDLYIMGSKSRSCYPSTGCLSNEGKDVYIMRSNRNSLF